MHVKILSGIFGSGKSTYAASLVGECEAGPVIDRGRVRIVSADHFFTKEGVYDFKPENIGKVHAACLRAYVRECLSSVSDETVIVDNTNTTTEELAPYVALAAAYGHTCEILTFKVQAFVGAERNVHRVPFEVCDKMWLRLNARRLPLHWNVREIEVT